MLLNPLSASCKCHVYLLNKNSKVNVHRWCQVIEHDHHFVRMNILPDQMILSMEVFSVEFLDKNISFIVSLVEKVLLILSWKQYYVLLISNIVLWKKHLEGFVVKYDLSVRDSDGSVVQLQYGEDGLAVEKCTYFKEAYAPFLVANQSSILREDEYSRIVQMCHSTNDIFIRKTLKKIRALMKETRDLAANDDYNDATRFKISDERKIPMTLFINHYRFFDPHTWASSLESKDTNKAREIMVKTSRDLSDEKREQYNHGVMKFWRFLFLICQMKRF